MRGYTIYRDSAETGRKRSRVGATRYTRSELEEMTTFQMRNICYKERLIDGLMQRLDREALIGVILKYLSAEEHLFIERPCEGGMDRLRYALSRYGNTPLQGNGGITVPARLSVYQGLAIDERDGYAVSSSQALVDSNVLLVNEQQELCGIFNLRKHTLGNGFYLSASSESQWVITPNRQYSLLFFRKRDSEYLYNTYYQDYVMPPVHLQYYKIPLAELEIRELAPTDAVLAIDFGTSNTTVGSFLVETQEVQFVKFPDSTYKELQWTEAIPTALCVADCANPEHILYKFGYDALLYARRSSYSSRASLFQGMKRWVSDYNRMVEVMDAEGNTTHVSRSDLLGAYLKYIISMAEHQFKCKFKRLHFSSPVKMKSPFLTMFADILPEYEIEQEDALDEGMAVLYNTIADGLEQGSFIEGQEYKALVIDCGGGTTDLSSCSFTVEDGHMSYKIDIQTTYENGDTHFGGQNITYRIMQFMKIVFADYYRHGKRGVTDIDTLIDIPSNDLFREIDLHGLSSVYAKLDDYYEQAEKVIPTAFALFQNRPRDEYLRVRGNFHFLWEIAEEMKEQFFRKTGILRNRFYSEVDDTRDNDLQITTMDRWFLSVFRNGELKDEYEFPDVVFNIKEITQLIKGDIYNVVRKFLDDFYNTGRLSEYSIIKLTGQSCRIDVFREALKEFVPGRSIEFRQKPIEGRVPELKLACLRGAIRYLNARKSGVIEAKITNQAAVIPYSVTAYTHNGREVRLIQHLDRSDGAPGAISRPSEVAEVELFLRGSDGGVRQKYKYMNQPKAYTAMLYEDIAKRLDGRIPQDDTDSIMNGETKFFVFADHQAWGFQVFPIARQSEQLYVGEQVLFPFENDMSELDFFDGMK
ncbi:hypothetical protein D3C77_243530 [compost metagenome]